MSSSGKRPTTAPVSSSKRQKVALTPTKRDLKYVLEKLYSTNFTIDNDQFARMSDEDAKCRLEKLLNFHVNVARDFAVWKGKSKKTTQATAPASSASASGAPVSSSSSEATAPTLTPAQRELKQLYAEVAYIYRITDADYAAFDEQEVEHRIEIVYRICGVVRPSKLQKTTPSSSSAPASSASGKRPASSASVSSSSKRQKTTPSSSSAPSSSSGADDDREVADDDDREVADDAKEAAARAFYKFKKSFFIPEGKTRQPARDDEQLQAARDAHRGVDDDVMKELRYTRWEEEGARYLTQTTIDWVRHEIKTYTFADATTASKLLSEWADACNSTVTKRTNKAKTKKDLESKRAADLATHGDNSAMERRVLVSVREDAKAHGIEFHVLPDMCLADALYRTADMPLGTWLLYQQKTTAEMFTRKDTRSDTYQYGWQFKDVTGYGGMLVICECEGGGKIWVLTGTTLDAGVRNDLVITLSKETWGILGVPCDKTCFPVNREGLFERMLAECAKVVVNDETALRTATLNEAEGELGKKQRVERAGILAYVEHVLEGAKPVEDGESLVRRQTNSGAVFWYPPDQQGKTDLYVEWPGDAKPTTLQFKTCQQVKRTTGWYVDLQTADGHDFDGTRITSNTYKTGDNDFYVIVLPATEAMYAIEDENHFWIIPEDVMVQHHLVDDNPLTCFSVHMPDDLQETRGGVAVGKIKYEWTKDFHRGFSGDRLIA